MITRRSTVGGSRYAPELEKRCRSYLKATTDSWRVDETYIKIKKEWMYLYRAVDSQGQTLEFLLSPTRDAEAAKRFFLKALQSSTRSLSGACPLSQTQTVPSLPSVPPLQEPTPRVINTDKNAAYPKAITELKSAGVLPECVKLRQVKYLNNLIEQDHRFIKRLVKPGLGFFSFETASRTLQGYEIINMMRKGQMQGVVKGNILGQVSFIASLFGGAV